MTRAPRGNMRHRDDDPPEKMSSTPLTANKTMGTGSVPPTPELAPVAQTRSKLLLVLVLVSWLFLAVFHFHVLING